MLLGLLFGSLAAGSTCAETTSSNAVGSVFSVSGKTDILENPFIAIGFDKASNVLTGSISAIRTAPGETNECRILFSSHEKSPKLVRVRYVEVSAASGIMRASALDQATVIPGQAGGKLAFDKKNLEGGCDRVLNFIGPPSIAQQGNTIVIAVPPREVGDWIGVQTIRSKRANFYKTANGADLDKAFLVAGETIYVYREQPGWYCVKFQGRNQDRGSINEQEKVAASAFGIGNVFCLRGRDAWCGRCGQLPARPWLEACGGHACVPFVDSRRNPAGIL